MTSKIIPRVIDPLWVGNSVSRPWYAYLRRFGEFEGLTDTQIAEITERLVALESGQGTGGSVQGVNSLQSFGALPGIVQLSLANDQDAPGNTYAYGTNALGEKGWVPVADAIAAGTAITKTVGADGIATIAHADTSSVANLTSDNANGVVLQDIAVTFDTFGHVQTITVGTTDLDLRYQPLDATLTALAGLTTAANKGLYATGVDAFATYDLSAGGRALGNASGAASTSPYFSALNTITNAAVTASGVNLWNIAGTSGSMAYLSGTNTWTLAATTVGGRALLNNAGTVNTAPWYSAANTVSLATTSASGRALWNVAGTANSLPYLGAADTWSLTALTAAGRALVGGADAAAQRATLAIVTPKGYIEGLTMQWVSTTALTVSSGAAYIEGSANVVAAPSAIAKAGMSLSASTWYHVYLYLNAGTPDIEIVTTAPATAYSGGARSKTGDNTRRYIGSVVTIPTGALAKFQHQSSTGEVAYLDNLNSAPFSVVSGGSATSATTVSCAGAVPVTSVVAKLLANNNASGAIAYISNPGALYPLSTSQWMAFVLTSGMFYANFSLDSSRQINYLYDVAPGGSHLFIRVTGYTFER